MKRPEFNPTPDQIEVATHSHRRYMMFRRAIFYTPREWAVMCLQNEVGDRRARRMVKRLIAWWKWLRKDGWELVDLKATEHAGGNLLWPIYAPAYFIETWKNTDTGEIREVERG